MDDTQSNRPANFGDISDLGLILLKAKLVLAVIRHETVPAQVRGRAVQRPQIVTTPNLAAVPVCARQAGHPALVCPGRGPSAIRLFRAVAALVRPTRQIGRPARAIRLLDHGAQHGVAPIHPKAMPALLTTAEEYETWLTAPIEEALTLQRPLPDDALVVVVRGAKHDG